MTNEISELSDHLGFWLRLVSNHASASFARKLEAMDVTVAEWVMMRELYGQQPMAPSRLAARMGMTRGAISKLADRLLAKRLIARTESSEDGRAHTLNLTAEGRHLTPVLARLADENDEEVFGRLSTEEQRHLRQILRALAERRGLKHPPTA
ncbi:MAG: MarR family transcriptional regulator [Rhizobiales bacterium 35-68-8]|nr:MAG: MarR family transcriptional regulator [Rhizobiales bacterium 35-68-8]HQR91270.1 MarR family transcriptional regulator [Caulobacter sp.]